jgi:tRNA pseudouridine13 synthase
MTASPEEINIGLELFFTDTPGISGRVKKTPDDFIVNERSIDVSEISDAELKSRDPTLPVYTYAKVRSRNWENNRLLQKFAELLGIGTDKVHFAGSKDKRAITTQLMAFQAPKEKVMAVSIDDVDISNIFFSTRVLKVGDLIGNDFEITISDPEVSYNDATEFIDATMGQLSDMNGSPNFFGVQRFGIIRPVTHQIGKLLVQKKVEEAVLWYIGHPEPGEPEQDLEARTEFDSSMDFEWAYNNYPKHLFFERMMIKHLVRYPEDYYGAIQQLPKNLATMFVHAYQSYLFNIMLCNRIRAGLSFREPLLGDIVLPIDEYKLPIHKTWIPVTADNIKKLTKQCKAGKAYISAVLFGSETSCANGEYGEIEQKVIENENLTQKDFIQPDMPELSSKGSRREIVVPVTDFKCEVFEDHIKMNFGLIKGAYATTFLREIMKSPIRNY